MNSWPSKYFATLFEARTDMQPVVSVTSASRLHFGLFSIGKLVGREFGGLGLMVSEPQTNVIASPSDQLEILGSVPKETRSAVASWFRYKKRLAPDVFREYASESELPVRVHVNKVAPRHCGLGSGTQLALSVATAVSNVFGLEPIDPTQSAQSVGRGGRSAIGTYGFFQGGLLVDRGKKSGDALAPLDLRIDFPEPWKILLVIDQRQIGLSGQQEKSAFHALPSVTPSTRDKMISLVRDQIVPGVMTADFDRFSESLYEFGYRSGSFFAAVQGGPYNGRAVSETIEFIRQLGFPAVGQSSWGPCIFMIGRHDEEIEDCSKQIAKKFGKQHTLIKCSATNRGATVVASTNHQPNPITFQ